MYRNRSVIRVLAMAAVLLSPAAVMAATKTISGSVSYEGTLKGRIYITARATENQQWAYGTTISEPGGFQIRGVEDDAEYVVSAFMDADGNGTVKTNEPFAVSYVVPKGMQATNVALKLADNLQTPPNAPSIQVFPQDEGLFVRFDSYWYGNMNFSGTAEGYLLQWSTDPYFRSGKGITGGVRRFGSRIGEVFIAVKTTEPIFVRAAGLSGDITGTFTTSLGPFLLGETGGTNSVSGTITVPKKYVGQTIILIGQSGREYRSAAVKATSTKFAYSLGGFLGEKPWISAFIDLNSDGVRDTSDPYLGSNRDGTLIFYPTPAPAMAVPGVYNPAPAVSVEVHGDRYLGRPDRFELVFYLNNFRPATTTSVVAGPALEGPVDISTLSSSYYGSSRTRVIVPAAAAGDRYTLRFEYPDGSVETKDAVVTGVPGFPIPVEPVGLVPFLLEQTLRWKRGDVVLYSDFTVSGEGLYTSWWGSPPITAVGDEYSYTPDSFNPSYEGRTTWTLSHYDNFGNSATLRSPFYYGRGTVSLTAIEESGSTITGVTASLEDLAAGLVVQQKPTDDNGQVLFPDVIPGLYRLCFESPLFERQCPELSTWWYREGLEVPADETTTRTVTLYPKERDAAPPSATVVLNGGMLVSTEEKIAINITASDDSGMRPLFRFRWDDMSWPSWSEWTDEYPSEITVPSEGRHTFYAQFRDGSGHITSTSSAIILDSTPPVVFFDRTPDLDSGTTAPLFTIKGGDVVSYKFSLDGTEYSAEAPVSKPIQLSGLAFGTHTLAVLGRDAAGNWQVTPTEYIWHVDEPKAEVAVQSSGSAKTIAVGGTGVTAYRYRLGYGSLSRTRSVKKPIAIKKGYTGIVSVIGRSAAGTWQKIPTELAVNGVGR